MSYRHDCYNIDFIGFFLDIIFCIWISRLISRAIERHRLIKYYRAKRRHEILMASQNSTSSIPSSSNGINNCPPFNEQNNTNSFDEEAENDDE